MPEVDKCIHNHVLECMAFTRYEDTWVALHKRVKECAKAGEVSSHI